MLKINITLIWELIKFFTSRQIKETAKMTGFTRREGKLQLDTFFKAFTVGLWDLHDVTLATLSGKCEDLQERLKLTRQGLFGRINTGAEFLKELLNQVMDYTANKVYLQRLWRFLSNLRMYILAIAALYLSQLS